MIGWDNIWHHGPGTSIGLWQQPSDSQPALLWTAWFPGNRLAQSTRSLGLTAAQISSRDSSVEKVWVQSVVIVVVHSVVAVSVVGISVVVVGCAQEHLADLALSFPTEPKLLISHDPVHSALFPVKLSPDQISNLQLAYCKVNRQTFKEGLLNSHGTKNLTPHGTSWFSTTRSVIMTYKGLYRRQISSDSFPDESLWFSSYRKYLYQITWLIKPAY